MADHHPQDTDEIGDFEPILLEAVPEQTFPDWLREHGHPPYNPYLMADAVCAVLGYKMGSSTSAQKGKAAAVAAAAEAQEELRGAWRREISTRVEIRRLAPGTAQYEAACRVVRKRLARMQQTPVPPPDEPPAMRQLRLFPD